jgi:hypothetical protein
MGEERVGPRARTRARSRSPGYIGEGGGPHQLPSVVIPWPQSGRVKYEKKENTNALLLWIWERRSGMSHTRESLFQLCGRWKAQQAIMWRDVRNATEGKRTARNIAMVVPFLGGQRCIAVVLQFLQTMEVGMRGRCRREDSEDPGGRGKTGVLGCSRLQRGSGGVERGRRGTGKVGRVVTRKKGDSPEARAPSRDPGDDVTSFLGVVLDIGGYWLGKPYRLATARMREVV